ncbi:O-antigen polymerase [Macrococcus equi]|uniref:O-antigen polymerase n=1 Tax=Macrococcus equi TaxID=3395462 RepID=UPI0039BE2D5D
MIKKFDSKVLLWLYTLLFSLLVIVINKPILLILVFMAYLIFLAILVKFDLTHPYIWFMPFYFLYYSSHIILILFDINQIYQSSIYIYKIVWFSLIIMTLIIGTNKINYSRLKIDKHKFIYDYNNLIITWLCSLIACTYLVFNTFRSGATNKREMALQNSASSYLIIFFSILIISSALIIIYRILKNNVFPWLFTIINLVFLLLVFLVNGERNIILTYIIVVLLIYEQFYKKINKLLLISIGFCIIISIPLMQNAKNFLITLEFNNTLSGNIIVDIIQSEFTSASLNLMKVVDNQTNLFFGKTLIWDIGRIFTDIYQSPTAWYNNLYFPKVVKTGGGRGFSILAEGYINFSIFGILLWAAILALIIKCIYSISNKSYECLFIYLLCIPIIIYILRADFAFLFSNFLKQILLPILLILLFNKIFKLRKV